MLRAFRIASHLCPSSRSSGLNDNSHVLPPIAVLLVATMVDDYEEGNNSRWWWRTNDVLCEEAPPPSSSSSSTSPGYRTNHFDETPLPYRNFVASSSFLAANREALVALAPTVTVSATSVTSAGASHDVSPRLQRANTSKRMEKEKSRRSFFEIYEVKFDDPLGSGAYGDVYLCRERNTGEACALKKIPKEFTEDAEFQREMDALLHIRAHGGHPNICMLRENFDEEDDYLLVLDLLDGGEMFDHLIKHGAYSEADASRLIRQVASALDFLHGIGVVHADLKPENVMLRKTSSGDAVIIKLIDFGCSEVLSHPEELDGMSPTSSRRVLTPMAGATTAYCPPESFDDVPVLLQPSSDMWALGVIIYMMLLGRHPFDSKCDASDEEIAKRIKKQRQPPLTKDLRISPSALDLLRKLMEPDPKQRMTAHELLHHPWVTGETASEYIMEDSAQRLKQLSGYKSGIEKTVIEKLLSFSTDEGTDESSSNNDKQSSLLERAFNHIDKDKKGFLDRKDLKALSSTNNAKKSVLRRRGTTKEEAEHKMSFDNFSDIIGQNMKSIHFKKGQVIYNEDDEGDYMYFINSGTIEVSTKDGFRTRQGQGSMFGKGGIMGRKRRTTITCTTPVNALRIDKDFFSKYVIKGSPLATMLREKANKEKFERALDILERVGEMTEHTYNKDDYIFKEGESPVDAYVVKEGLVDISCAEHHINFAKAGRLFGINSQALSRNRKASACCVTDTCVIKSIPLDELKRLAQKYPVLSSTLQELALRQEFRRAVVIRRMRSFPSKSQLKEAFDDIDQDRSGTLNEKELRQLMQSLGAAFSDGEM